MGVDAHAMAIHRILNPDESLVQTYRVGQEGTLTAGEERRATSLTRQWQDGQLTYEEDLVRGYPEEAENLKEKFGGLPVRSCAEVPIPNGVISVLSVQARAFSTSDLMTIEQVAKIFSVGISRVEDLERLEVSSRDLERQTEELARSNADLEQFASVAFHDLQEPLRMVSSYLQLLERRYKDELDDDAGEFIDFAVDGAERMSGLINDLLQLSRVGTRGKPPVPTDCGSLLDQALANLTLAIDESGVLVERDPLPVVPGDEGQLVQLFQNLIGNAIKFRGQEGPRVRISATEEDAWWVFRVEDNGIGMDSKHAERIFQIFQRLHTREEYEGSGIGLALCKKIVERHGGEIWVESEIERGTTFYFTLPKGVGSGG